MPRQEEKMKYIDWNNRMDLMSDDSCNQCKGSAYPSSYEPSQSAVQTVGFMPTNRNYNIQNAGSENNLIFSTTTTEKKEIVETDMPKFKNNFRENSENFGQVNSNDVSDFSSNANTYYDANNDVLRGIMQEYDRVKDKGEFYTFKSTHRRKNVDLSSYMSPPQKTLGRGFGVPNNWEKTYLGDQTRGNDFRIVVKDSERFPDVPYYLTALPVFKNLGGDDTRYLNFKLRG